MAQRGEGYLYFKHTQGHAPHHTLLMEMLLAKQNDGVSPYLLLSWIPMTISFCDSCSREPANTKKKILVPRTSGLIATCKFLSQCEWWLWLHQCCAGEIEVKRKDWFYQNLVWKTVSGWRRSFEMRYGCHFECLLFIFGYMCEEEEENPFFEAVWLINWLAKKHTKFSSLIKSKHTHQIHWGCHSLKSLVFDTITYPCLSLCLSNCSHNYEWMRLNEEEMSLLETTLLLKTLFNYILEDKNNNNLLMKTKSMRRWDFLSQKLLLKEADNFEKPTSNNSFWLDLKKEGPEHDHWGMNEKNKVYILKRMMKWLMQIWSLMKKKKKPTLSLTTQTLRW